MNVFLSRAYDVYFRNLLAVPVVGDSDYVKRPDQSHLAVRGTDRMDDVPHGTRYTCPLKRQRHEMSPTDQL